MAHNVVTLNPTEEYHMKFQTDLIAQIIEKQVSDMIITESDLKDPSEIKNEKNFKGVYMIFSNLDSIPAIGNPIVKSKHQVGEYKMMYIGKASTVKSRLKAHLTNKDRFASTSGMSLETIRIEELEDHFESKGKVFPKSYFKSTSISDLDVEDSAFRNGINSEEYPEGTFKYVAIQADEMNESYEYFLKNKYGQPLLCKQ